MARTLAEPGAAVVVVARAKLAYAGTGMELRLTGHVDFAADRCRLDGPAGAVVCDGTVQYSQLADGRWARQAEPGRWSNVHPRWALELLAADFDAERAAAITHAGLEPGLAAEGEAELDEAGRVARVAVRLQGSDAALDWDVAFADYGPLREPIALPPAADVVELDEHVAELRDRQPG